MDSCLFIYLFQFLWGFFRSLVREAVDIREASSNFSQMSSHSLLPKTWHTNVIQPPVFCFVLCYFVFWWPNTFFHVAICEAFVFRCFFLTDFYLIKDWESSVTGLNSFFFFFYITP